MTGSIILSRRDSDGANGEQAVNRTLLWLLVAAMLVAGWLLYRSRSDSHLNVTPDANRAIENAKHR